MQNSEIIEKIRNSLQSSREIRVSYNLEQDLLDAEYKPKWFDLRKKEKQKTYNHKMGEMLEKYNQRGYYPQFDPYDFIFNHGCGDCNEETSSFVCSVDKRPLEPFTYQMCQDKKQCCHCLKRIYAMDPKGLLFNEYEMFINPTLSKKFDFKTI